MYYSKTIELLKKHDLLKVIDEPLDVPVLINVFCSPKADELLIGNADAIANEIEGLFRG